MKAQDVLHRYAAGERNFCNANLRGANFKGQDLSGADFSGADIRSANFTNAILKGVKFTEAQAGVQSRQMIVRVMLLTILSMVTGILYGFVGTFSASFLSEDTGVTETYVFIASLMSALAITFFQGFTLRALYSTLFMIVSVVSIVDLLLGFLTSAPGFALFASAGAAIVCTIVIIGANIAICINSITFVFAYGSVYANLYIFINTLVLEITTVRVLALGGAVRSESASIAAQVVAVILLLSSVYPGQQALKEKENFLLALRQGLRIGVVGGTSFCGADLTGANFRKACLKSVNFANSRQRQTILTHVWWQGARQLNLASVGSSILQNYQIRLLLTTPEQGYKQDLTDANLRGANLSGVTLEQAILRRAILSDALLRDAVLEGAILTEAQAVNADFTGAHLTGATLEAWNIDSTTTLKNIDCRYVFLRETPDVTGSRERRPHDPDKLFQPGDFEKFFKEMIDEVQILIRNGIDPIAFRAAMKNIMEQNPKITQDSIRGYEKQGEDVLLTLQVPPETDKGKLERDWDSGYQSGLKAGREVAQLESGPKFEKLAFLLAEKNITNIQRTEVMTGNDQSQNIDVKGDFTVTANNSVVSFRDTSGQVTNQITQLGDEPTQAQLKDMLAQLQAAIEGEPNLSEAEKTEALEEVKQIAAAGQAPEDGPMKKAAKRALNVLKGMTVGLGATTQFVTACHGLLPAIALLFGL